MQSRPCFLVIDTEHASSISTRKLVLETAKYNVITAYSAAEAVVLLQRFPAIDAVVLNCALREASLPAFWETLRANPRVKLVVVGDAEGTPGMPEPAATVESYSPPRLLDALQVLFPREAEELLRHEELLERTDG